MTVVITSMSWHMPSFHSVLRSPKVLLHAIPWPWLLLALALTLSLSLIVWGLRDLLIQTAEWDHTQQETLRRAVREARRHSTTPPDWDAWITQEIDRITRTIDWTRIHLGPVLPPSPDRSSSVSRQTARVIPFRPRRTTKPYSS